MGGDLSGMENNQILIEQHIDEAFESQTQYEDRATFFEFLASSKVMASYGLDVDEVERGVIGGARDGGCDAAYILCNEQLIGEDADIATTIKRNSKVDIIVIQCKTGKTFVEDVLLKWKDLCRDLLDFGLDMGNLSWKYSEPALEMFERIRSAVRTSALRGAAANMRFLYVANATRPSTGVERQAEELVDLAESLAGASSFSSEVDLVGVDKLMDIWFPPDESELLIRFSSAYTSVPQRSDFLGLVTLSDYYDFLVDGESKLRAYLFEANIRDYEGKVEVNRAIRDTLGNPSGEDFWWLNNGVTILAASAVQATGGVVRMEEPRIVNGLQTTYEIFSYMQGKPEGELDGRNVMVRIIVPEDDATRSKVIMATNSQTRVKKTSLRATDLIHQQIETYLKRKGLYYERRKNYYKNQGMRPEEIVSISFLAQCLMSIILDQPDQARARPSTLLADERKYRRLFRKNGNLEAYYKAAALGKRIVVRLPKIRPEFERAQLSDIRFYVIMAAAHLLAGKAKVDFADLASIDLADLTDEVIAVAADAAMDVYLRLGGNPIVAKSSVMPGEVLKSVAPNMGLPHDGAAGD